MTVLPKISIITPNLNGAKYLECTIRSVIEQQYPNLEYIIIDGGSTDGSLEIIRKYERYLSYWVSREDAGMYFAIEEGFGKSTGSILGWLNSDDILFNKALFTISEIFSINDSVQWLQGHPVVIDEISRIVYNRPAAGSKLKFYLRDYLEDGAFIQQESTFWSRGLWEKAGGCLATNYKFAADFELWMRFFDFEKMYLTNAILGAFRLGNQAQVSIHNYDKYLAECNEIVERKYAGLPEPEKRILHKIQWRRRMLTTYPALGKLFQLNSLESKTLCNSPGINFRFNTQSFGMDESG